MRIDNFNKCEWIEICEILSEHSINEPVIRKLIGTINSRTNLFHIAHQFLLDNEFNPIFFPDRTSIEKCKDGFGMTKRFTNYESKKGKGFIQFKKEYQEYIMKRYDIVFKEDN